MKLGLNLGYSGAALNIPVEQVQRAETLGFDSVWTAEAYGSDAVTPLAYIAAAKTSRIKLGTAIMQLAARTPANAAMTAATVDALAGGGRFIAGIGVSGPQIVEGWYGQPWGKPIERIRITSRSCARSSRARGTAHRTRAPRSASPTTGPRRHGLGPNPSVDPARAIPIFRSMLDAAIRRATVRLRGEITDGSWRCTRRRTSAGLDQIHEVGLAKRSVAQDGVKDFEQCRNPRSVHVVIDTTSRARSPTAREVTALYVGGMGSKEQELPTRT